MTERIEEFKKKLDAAIKEENKRDVPNQVKKRTVFATMNEFLEESPELEIGLTDLDKYIEDGVKHASE